TVVPAVWNNTSGTWQTAANWSTGSAPGTVTATEIGLTATNAFTITTGSTPLTTNGFGLGDPNALVQITSNTSLEVATGGASTVPSGITEYGGTVEVTGGNTLTALSVTQRSPSTELLLDPGSLLDILGALNNTNQLNTPGTITITSGNSIAAR